MNILKIKRYYNEKSKITFDSLHPGLKEFFQVDKVIMKHILIGLEKKGYFSFEITDTENIQHDNI